MELEMKTEMEFKSSTIVKENIVKKSAPYLHVIASIFLC